MLREYVEHLAFEPGYNDEGEVWWQCRFCHQMRGEGHDDWCPAQNVE